MPVSSWPDAIHRSMTPWLDWTGKRPYSPLSTADTPESRKPSTADSRTPSSSNPRTVTLTRAKPSALEETRMPISSLAVPSGDHVPIDHVTHDPRNECVASRLGREPALPLELVQRLGQRFSGDARGLPEPRPGDPAPEHCRCHERPLRIRRQATEVDPDRRHDVVRQLAW